MVDLLIIGGGPAGLAAATNGAAEGLMVTLLEARERFGGQAGTSARIENYLGFPDGLTGAELTRQSAAQARRLGAELVAGVRIIGVEADPAGWLAICDSGAEYQARAILIAAGVDYRLLEIPGADDPSVIYGASPADHRTAAGAAVVVIGGANSAGQAALSLARYGARVALVARSPLEASMSRYLVARIVNDPRIVVYEASPVSYEPGELALSNSEAVPAAMLFPYIGARPRTGFLRSVCTLDASGYVVAQADYSAGAPGLFVIGDVRAGSRKRVQAATGDAAECVPVIYSYLMERNPTHA